jgi:osmotically-inducible protein OsmY
MIETGRSSDADVETAVIHELRWIPSINSALIGVAVLDGTVTLSGQVGTYSEKLWAERAALRVHGVSAVCLELTVGSAWAGIRDADVLQESKEALHRNIDVPDSVTVSVESHVVTLSGEVQWNYQREAACRAVQHLKGVIAVHTSMTLRSQVAAPGLAAAIGAALSRNAQLASRTIGVTVDDGFVTLRGLVDSWAERRQAESVCWAAPGVIDVDNQLRLQHHVSSPREPSE